LYLAQIRPYVDQARSQSRKTDKVASSDVARSRVDRNTFHTMIYLLLAVSSHPISIIMSQIEERENVARRQVLSQYRKTDKIASSDVARSRVDWNTFHTP
jgi:hypothetical protein